MEIKLEHLLNNYVYVKRDKHDIWQTFVENDILTYNEFVDSQTLESRKKMFTDGKLILAYNTLLYYNILCQDDEVQQRDDPTLWNKDVFRKWETNDYPKSTAAYTVSLAGNTTTTKVISTDILSNKEVISNVNGGADDDGKVTIPTTTTDSKISNNSPDKNSNFNMNNSKEERKQPKEVSVAAANDSKNDDVDIHNEF